MLNIIANFLLAMFGTLLLTGAAKWIAGKITTAEASRYVSFGFGFGYMTGKFSFVKPAGSDISLNMAQVIGSVVALVILWFILFRRNHVEA
jgi:ABC-type Fe3+-siderophore transport system permease subunit